MLDCNWTGNRKYSRISVQGLHLENKFFFYINFPYFRKFTELFFTFNKHHRLDNNRRSSYFAVRLFGEVNRSLEMLLSNFLPGNSYINDREVNEIYTIRRKSIVRLWKYFLYQIRFRIKFCIKTSKSFNWIYLNRSCENRLDTLLQWKG